MGIAKFAFVLCVAAVYWTQGEARKVCGLEIEYRGYDPIEALRFIQERQIQEYTQFNNLLNQLKFKVQTDDYRAWKRCLKEYESAKRRFINKCTRVRLHFQKHLKALTARNLAAEQYQLELQNLLGQFEVQFKPSVETFHTNIKTLFDTIQDEKLRRQWWSTVKTTEVTTDADGTQTRTSISETSSGIGGQQTGFSKTSETVSKKVGGGYGKSGYQNDISENSISSGFESQSQSGYGAATQVVKQSSSRSGVSAGSSADNSQINFSQVQTRTGIKEGYGSDSASEDNAQVKQSGYGRKRRSVGLYA